MGGWSGLFLPLVASAAAIGSLAVAAERTEIETADGRRLTGTVVREAQDGSLLLEHGFGRYELLAPDAIRCRTAVADGPPPPTAAEQGRLLLAELPVGFRFLTTKHYIVCFDTSRDYARWCAAIFERLHDAFGNYWRRAGLDLTDPEQPLVVVIYADKRAYEADAAGDLGGAAGRVAGYYNLLSNRVTTFDLTGSDLLAADRGRPSGRVGLEILSSPAATGLIATLVHEATHQLAFNSGMHRRLAPVPLWVSEGIAMYFETPDLKNDRGWTAVGAVNRPRLDHFLKSYRPGCVAAIVGDDAAFRSPDQALDCYATAWAVCHHLLQTRKSEFVDYLRDLGTGQPLDEDTPAERLEAFRAAFGDPAAVEQAVVRSMARLAARPR
ncbi:MAG: hypothetical protein RLZZ440_775 [Planctomycetota bacterium]